MAWRLAGVDGVGELGRGRPEAVRLEEELGTTILFVEQNLSVVQELADRCYAVDKGRIVDELQDRDRLASHLAV